MTIIAQEGTRFSLTLDFFEALADLAKKYDAQAKTVYVRFDIGGEEFILNLSHEWKAEEERQ